MNKKLLFFDIDGTLLIEGDYNIPSSTIEAIHKAQNNGHLCFINTGRPISTIDSNLLNIGFDGYICGCGTYVQYNNDVIYHALMEHNSMNEIIDLSIDCNIDTVFEGRDGNYFPENMEFGFFREVFDYYKEQGFPVDTYDKGDYFIYEKLASFAKKSSDTKTFLSYFREHDGYDVIDRGNDFYEIIPMYCSKASGIQVILDYLNYDISDTISFGDSNNDLSMLTYTNESVAMGNASPSLFDKVTYVTSNVDDHGIYNALKHFKLI